MRPIDADKLKKELVDTPFYFRCETTPDMLTSVQDRLNECLETIDNMPTLDFVPEWHDLTKNPDDLPTEHEIVLCYYRYKSWDDWDDKWKYEYDVGWVHRGLWCGEPTNGMDAEVLRWQRIIDPLQEETKCK